MIATETRQASTRTVVPCQECGTPVMEVRDGMLVIRSRHHGETHCTILSLRALMQLLEEQDNAA